MTSSHQASKSSNKKISEKPRTIISRIAMVLFGIYLFIWAASPSISYQILNDYLIENHGLVLSKQSHIQYNPFLSKLSIKDLSILDDDRQTIAIDELLIEVQLHRLLFNELTISQLAIDGLTLDVELGDRLRFAGFTLPSQETDVVADKKNKDDYQLNLPLATITNSIIEIRSLGSTPFQHQIKINELKLSELFATKQKQDLRLSLEGAIDKAAISVNDKLSLKNGIGSIDTQFKLSNYSFANLVQHLPNTIDTLAGNIDLQTSITLNINNDLVALIASTQLDLRDIHFANEMMDLTSANFAINLSDINFQNQELAIHKIIVEGLDADLTLNAIKQEKEGLVKSAKLNESKKNTQPKIKVDEIVFVENGLIQFNDKSVDPAFHQDINLSQLWIKQINSQLKSQISPFSMSASINKYTTFNLQGDVQIFSEKINLNASAAIKEFSLPEINRYLAQAMGFQFESGSLDTTLDLKIKDSVIDGASNINIRSLELSSKERYDDQKMSTTTSMPLNIALGILKDDDNNLKLEIPIEGDVNSPSFGLGSFVSIITQKAIKTAAITYLINTFVPYANIVNLTLSAGDFILTTKFEDLTYQANQAEINEDKKSFVEQFVQLLKDKTELQVKACAIANQHDIFASKKTFKKVQAKITYLKTLAKRRMDHFKDSVVEQGIESSRILLCSPKIDLDDKKPPRIEFSL